MKLRQDITEILLKEKVEDTNGVIRSCKSKQDGQCKKGSLKTLTHSPKRQSEIIDFLLYLVGVSLFGETGILGEDHRPVAIH
jgi:hypothetical protein